MGWGSEMQPTPTPAPALADLEMGVRLLQIIALLLPLAGFFLQALLRAAASDQQIDIEPLATGVGYVMVFLSLSSVAAVFSMGLGGRSRWVFYGYGSLVIGLVFVAGLVLRFAMSLSEAAREGDEPRPATRYVGPPPSYDPDQHRDGS